jgi:arsenate reductase
MVRQISTDKEFNMPLGRKPKLLFLCTGNSARSVMAEALLRHHAGEHIDAYSAGLEPKGINPFTERVLAEKNIDMTGQYSKDVMEYLGRVNFGYLITVCAHAEANCPVAFLGVSERQFWDFDDPAAFQGSDEEKLTKFRQTRDALDARILRWLEEEQIPVSV